jgi:hypothetical protein
MLCKFAFNVFNKTALNDKKGKAIPLTGREGP